MMTTEDGQIIEQLLYSITSLVELSESVLSAEDFFLNSKAVLHQISGILLIPKCLIMQFDDYKKQLTCFVSRGIDYGEFRLNFSRTDLDIIKKTDQIIKINADGKKEELSETVKKELLRMFPEASLWINLKLKNELAGVLILGKKFMGGEITEQDTDFLKIISRILALALSNYKLVSTLSQKIDELIEREIELKKRKLELEILYDVGLEVTFLAESVSDITTKILQNAVGLLDARAGALFLYYDDSRKKIKPVASINTTNEELARIDEEFTVIRYALQEKLSSIRSVNPSEDEPFPDSELITVPIIYKNNVNGVFMLIDKEGRKEKVHFTEDDKKLLSAFANQAAVAIENSRLYKISLEKERMQREIELAAEIQRSLIPEKFPSIEGYDFSGLCIPCRTVGGDYYNYFQLSDGRLLIAVADVSGKGIPAALLVSSINSVLYAHTEIQQDIRKLVQILSRAIYYSATTGKYATAFFLELNPVASSIRYVNAGHNPPLLITNDNRKIELTEGGYCIGMFKESNYNYGTLPFDCGDQILIYTDGVTEQTNDKDEFFGEERLLGLLIENRSNSSSETNAQIINAVHSFRGSSHLNDDITLVALKKNY